MSSMEFLEFPALHILYLRPPEQTEVVTSCAKHSEDKRLSIKGCGYSFLIIVPFQFVR